MTYEIPKGHLSSSSMRDLLQCPKRYEFKYVKQLPAVGNKAMTLGSVAHTVFEDYYKDVLEDRDNRMTGKQMVEFAMDEAVPSWFSKNEAWVTPVEKREIELAIPDITESYVDNVGKYVVPVSTEQTVMYESQCGVMVEARIDLVREKNGHNEIVDYKITSKPWTSTRLANELQFLLYSHILGMSNVQIQNILPNPPSKMVSVAVNYGVEDPKSAGTYSFVAGPNIGIHGNDFGSGNGEYLEGLIKSCAELITSGIFPPTLPDNWWCSPKWCSYWGICRGKFRGSAG